MPDSNILGSLVAIVAAATWGAGDFMGGMATRKNSPYQVVALVALSGFVILLVAMLCEENLGRRQKIACGL